MREKIETITSSRRNMAVFVILATFLLLAVSLLFPHPAYAWPLDDLKNWVNDTVKGFVEGMLNTSVSFMDVMNVGTYITAPFDQLLNPGQSDQSSTYGVVKGIQTTVKGLGASILSLALLMQLIKISQKVDGSQTFPVVKEIVLLLVFFFVFNYLIGHSFDICTAAYDEINKSITGLWGDGGRGSVAKFKFGDSTDIQLDLATLLVLLIIMLIMLFTSFIAAIISYALVFARALQLYIMAACSPIPFALMAFDETRQMGVNFCKNFIAVSLSGLIIACLILVYPALVGDILTAGAFSPGDSGEWVIGWENAALACVPVVACSAMYVYALMKSGSWARDILGG